MVIRPERAGDFDAIAEVNCTAFGGPLEARLVERLRQNGQVITSLVAVDEERVVGHILFSPVLIRTSAGPQIELASLAPMAVLPLRQRQGIGSLLVREGIEACRVAAQRAIIVVGHSEYYPRFGFSHLVVARLNNPFASDNAFMGLELVSGALSELGGEVVYPVAFAGFSS